jgi:recombination protein RecT
MTTQAQANNPTASLRNYLLSPAVTRELARVLPANLPPERLVRQALTLAHANPDLLKCSPMSVLAGIVRAAELQLELSGVLGHAYLVPRWNGKAKCHEATFQVGYRGFVSLAFRSGKVRALPMRVVYASDEFDVRYGTDPTLFHQPARGKRGEPVAYYALAQLASGGFDFELLFHDEAVLHRQKYGPKGNSPWETNFEDMALKTCARRLAKRLPLSVESYQAALLDEAGEAGVPVHGALPMSGDAGEHLAGLLDGADLPEPPALPAEPAGPGEAEG